MSFNNDAIHHEGYEDHEGFSGNLYLTRKEDVCLMGTLCFSSWRKWSFQDET